MTASELKRGRLDAAWTQARLARRLGVSQAYLSLMESGKRPVPEGVQRRVASLFDMSPTVLPSSVIDTSESPAAEAAVEQGLASLGYPGLTYRSTGGPRRNPSDLLLTALALGNLDPRLTEALPWLLVRFEGFDVEPLVARAKSQDLQNRLGFTVALARRVAEHNPMFAKRSSELKQLEQKLERSRLAHEDTYGQAKLSERMRRWLRENRSPDAGHWKLLTDLKPEHLPYAESQGTVARIPS